VNETREPLDDRIKRLHAGLGHPSGDEMRRALIKLIDLLERRRASKAE